VTSRRLADRIAEGADRSFVGRREELAALRAAMAPSERAPAVVFVHGPAGVGTSSLVRAALAPPPPGVRAVTLDCRAVEPTPERFLAALAGALGAREGTGADVLAQMLCEGAARAVLALDGYESFALLDAWLRCEFLPLAPAGLLTVVALRGTPSPAWATSPGWQDLVMRLELRPLGHADAELMLARRGVAGDDAARIARFARGHPLALELGAAVARARPGIDLDGGPPPEVIRNLVGEVLRGLDPEAIEAVRAAATVRRVTEPMLGALLESDPRVPFERLSGLPFVDHRPDGLALAEPVREAVARDLARRDPDLWRGYRQRAAALLAERARSPGARRLWETTADLLHLIDNPMVRDAFFPPGDIEIPVEPAGEADREGAARIVERWGGPAEAARFARWWAAHPGSVHVARGPGGAPVGVLAHVPGDALDPGLAADDPVVRAWSVHLGERPLPPGGRALMLRYCLGDPGEEPSAALAAAFLDVKRAYLEMRPDLRRVYTVTGRLEEAAPLLRPLGFAPLSGEGLRGGPRGLHPLVLDFGEASVDGWLARLIDAELDAGPPGPASGPLEALSPRELEVLRLLADGLSNRAIAAELVISEKTAARHVANVFAKLGVHSRARAARIAAESGLTRA
jgi:DNA-binding CsgD family transcriptional regulator